MQPGSFLSGVMSRVTFDSASGWHSGIKSDVRLAAMMPAMRAVPSTSPFLALPERINSSVALLMITRPSAIAMRSVAGLADTSTIRASPLLSMWVRAVPSLQAVHAMRDGGIFQIAGCAVVECGHDDQDAVGTMGAGLDHLIDIEHEILAQHRQIGRRACRDHEIEMALE